MKMYSKLLANEFHEESTTAAVTGFIKSMAGSNAARCSDTLKLVLRNLHSKEVEAVLLRCSNPFCPHHKNPHQQNRSAAVSLGWALNFPRSSVVLSYYGNTLGSWGAGVLCGGRSEIPGM